MTSLCRWSCCPVVVVLLGCLSGDQALPLVHPSVSSSRWIDLSHPLDGDSHRWPGFLGFNLTVAFKGRTKEGFWGAAHNFVSSEHTGTHMDAPTHVGLDGTWSVNDIPVDRFVAHAALVNIADRCQADPESGLTADDLVAWKRQHGEFVYPTIVLVRTGQAAHRLDYRRYWGVPDDYQPPAVADFAEAEHPPVHYPGIAISAGKMLADDDAVVGVGLDAPSLDMSADKYLTVHQILFAKNKFGLENVADMSGVPATGATIMALPMKIAGGTGGPTRILVRLPDEAVIESAPFSPAVQQRL